MTTPSLPGIYGRLLVTVFIWGGTWVAGRVLVEEVTPLAAGTWRYFMASVTLLGLVLWRHRSLPALTGRQWLLVAGMGATGIFLYNLCFLYGLHHVEAGHGALVVALNPALIAVGAWLLLGEQMTPLKALGAAIASAGCLTVIGRGSPLAPLLGDYGPGDALIVGAAFLWSAYTLIGRLVLGGKQALSPLVATAYASVLGGLMLLVSTLLLEPGQLRPTWSPAAWGALLFLSLLGTTLAFTWFGVGVAAIGATRASMFINLVPVFAVLQAAWLLGEFLAPSVLAGGGLVLAGVALTQYVPGESAS